MARRKLSIQSRLIMLVLGAGLMVELVTGWNGYQRAAHEADELLDAQLVQYAQIMLSLAHEGDDDEVALPDIQAHHYQNQVMFQIWDMEEAPRLMLRSPEAPHEWPPGVAGSGYSDAVLSGHAWRFFVLAGEDERTVLAAHDLHIREELAREIAFSNVMPSLVAIPILTILLLLAIRRGLTPLRDLENELSSRSPDRLDALPDDDLPRELGPLARTMNALFGRLRQTLEHERRFTSDAAHELRTPLAALKMQLQVAQRTPDDAECVAAIGKALRGADRMGHLVTQLLALARLESSGLAGEMQSVELATLTGEVAADLAAMAADKGVALKVDSQSAGKVRGNPDLIRVLVRNLIDNAVRYTPAGGRVAVSLAGKALSVADNGPGVAPEERENLGLRFHRFGPQSAEGVGLGLSIVRRIAELHGATFEFREGLDGRGLSALVTFPPA